MSGGCGILYREWDLFSAAVAEQDVGMEFRLVYQGPLHSSGNKSASRKCHEIRRYFHPQLINLWNTIPALGVPKDVFEYQKSWIIAQSHGMTPIDRQKLSETYTLGTKSYLPLVCPEHEITCSLDIFASQKR